MAWNVAQKLIRSHLIDGTMCPGEEMALRIDQTLTQDATGTLVMLVLEAMQLDRVKTEISVQYVDHNILQEDHRNPDDHLFLYSACKRFGVWYSRPGNGVSHPLHMQRFGIPGRTLLGSDSHTPAAGALGMLAIGAGGTEVAMAMAGEPLYLPMPEIFGVYLEGELPQWVSAKDVILEMLRRHGVDGAVNCILEYHGPGVKHLSAMDRHVIANMGTELGATSTVFPSDGHTRRFLRSEGREQDWRELKADKGAVYDREDRIDLSKLEPLIAKPSSPGNVVPVAEVAGEPIYQAYIGSSANPGYRDFAIAAHMVRGRRVKDDVSFDINPTSRQCLELLAREGLLQDLLLAGARIHQAGCNGCIGMGQAPASGRNSLRTVPRNFPGRSGTKEDSVFLCSPETAAASALTGEITDPRVLNLDYPLIHPPKRQPANQDLFTPPPDKEKARKVAMVKGPNIEAIPEMEPLPDELELPVLLKVNDDLSTDEIMPAGAKVLPLRSSIPKIAQFVFRPVDENYVPRAETSRKAQGHAVVAGENYGQGSSREHAALAPRYLGLRVVVAKNFARIHRQNLINFGVLPLTFKKPQDYDAISRGDVLVFEHLIRTLRKQRKAIKARIRNNNRRLTLTHDLSERQCELLLAGGLINHFRQEQDMPKKKAA